MERIVKLEALLNFFDFPCEQPGDTPLLEWAIKEAENYAIFELNLSEIPEESETPLLNIAAGEYMKAKKAVLKSETDFQSLAPTIKRLELGDTKTEFDTDHTLTPEQRLDLLIEYLIKSGKSILNRYRRLRW